MSAPVRETGEAPRRRLPWSWIVIAVAVVAVPVGWLLADPPRPSRGLGRLPTFTLTDQDGRSFGSADLGGKPAVINFFFTSCPSICPRLTRAMRSLQRRFAGAGLEVQLVSISVDPETDTPARLTAYARKYEIDPRNWRLLTGRREEVRRTIVEGFRMHLGPRYRNADNMVDISHSGRFVLVDARREVVGYFRSDPTGLEALFQRVRALRGDEGSEGS